MMYCGHSSFLERRVVQTIPEAIANDELRRLAPEGEQPSREPKQEQDVRDVLCLQVEPWMRPTTRLRLREESSAPIVICRFALCVEAEFALR